MKKALRETQTLAHALAVRTLPHYNARLPQNRTDYNNTAPLSLAHSVFKLGVKSKRDYIRDVAFLDLI